MGVLGYSVIGHRADKTQRALGADQQVGKHIQRVIEINQRVQRQSGGVFQPVFIPNPLGQLCIGPCLLAKLRQLFQQRGLALAEGGHRCRLFGIQ